MGEDQEPSFPRFHTRISPAQVLYANREPRGEKQTADTQAEQLRVCMHERFATDQILHVRSSLPETSSVACGLNASVVEGNSWALRMVTRGWKVISSASIQ